MQMRERVMVTISTCMDMAKMVGVCRGSGSINYVHNTRKFSPETYNHIKAVWRGIPSLVIVCGCRCCRTVLGCQGRSP